RPETVHIDRGPNVALREMRRNGVSTVYVTDQGQKLLGYVTADDANEAAKQEKPLQDILKEVPGTVAEDTLLDDLFEPMNESGIPLAVIDENRRLLGIVVRGAVIAALSGDDKVLNGNGGEEVHG